MLGCIVLREKSGGWYATMNLSNHNEAEQPNTAKNVRRWYDTDPVLLEVINFMELAPIQAERYAQRLITGVERHVSKDMLKQVYDNIKADSAQSNRWYDDNRTLSLAIELLRIMPRDAQRLAALQFIEATQEDETTYAILKASFARVDLDLSYLEEDVDDETLYNPYVEPSKALNSAKAGALPPQTKQVKKTSGVQPSSESGKR
jgi:hypothetical protein